LIPIAAFAAISLFRIPVSTVVYGALMLLCPLSHLLMMKFMGGHEHQPAHEHQHQHEVIDVDAK
jgi:hypothetical protein